MIGLGSDKKIKIFTLLMLRAKMADPPTPLTVSLTVKYQFFIERTGPQKVKIHQSTVSTDGLYSKCNNDQQSNDP